MLYCDKKRVMLKYCLSYVGNMIWGMVFLRVGRDGVVR